MTLLLLLCFFMIIVSSILFFMGLFTYLVLVLWSLAGLLLSYVLYFIYNENDEIVGIIWFLLFSVWIMLGCGLFL